MIFFQKTIFKKFTPAILIVSLLFSIVGAVFLLPKKAEAIPVWEVVSVPVLIAVSSVWNMLQLVSLGVIAFTTGTTATNTTIKKIEDWITYAISILLNILLHQMLSMLTNEVVAWIQNGEEPRFLSMGLDDWLGKAANNAGGIFVDQFLGAGWLCEPFDLDIKIALRDVPTFETEAECTLTDIVDNIDNFYNDFAYGGWKGWIELTKPQNTFAGAYMIAQDKKAIIMAEEIKNMEKDLDMGEGFLSPKDCYWYNKDGNLVATQMDVWGSPPLPGECPSGSGCVSKCQIKTPGSVVSAMADEAVTNIFEYTNTMMGAAASQSGPFAPYVMAITNALVNRILLEAEGLLGATPVPSPNYGDIGEAENLPEIVSPAENYSNQQSAEQMLITLNPLKDGLINNLIPQQKDSLAVWQDVYNAYQSAIPSLEETMAECSGVIADNYNWALDEKNEIENNILPPLKEKIDKLENDSLDANDAALLIDETVVSVEKLIDEIEKWDEIYQKNDAWGFEELNTAQDNIDIAKEEVVANVQEILMIINIIIPSSGLDETADDLDELSEELYSALTEVMTLYVDLFKKIGVKEFPAAGTIYAELEAANAYAAEVIELANSKTKECLISF
ncbi:hypothetical protein KJ756_03140 [Patescibacteria group bacterium]|nr:hypothetical protein [Patescibacteria group bacterium]